MQKKTVIKLLTQLKANYRYTYRDMTKEELSLMVESWYACLRNVSDEQGENAFHVALCKMNVPPTVADVLGIVDRLERLNELSDAELWSELIRSVDKVRFLCANYSGENIRADVEKIYLSLPEAIRKFTDFDTFISYTSWTDTAKNVERTRFFKALPELREALRDKQIVRMKRMSDIEQKRLSGVKE